MTIATAMASTNAHAYVFIIPIASDGVDPAHPVLPDAFPSSQTVKLASGRLPDEFAPRVKALVREYHRRRRGA